jgi:biopolymer transport protein ExbB/TolQ
MTVPKMTQLAGTLNSLLPAGLEDFDVDAVMVALELELGSDFDHDQVERHLGTLRRSRRALSARQRKIADWRKTIEAGQRVEPKPSKAMAESLDRALERKAAREGGSVTKEMAGTLGVAEELRKGQAR